MTIYFSASTLGFYDSDFESDFKSAGSWPSDLVQVTNTDHATFTGGAPTGRIFGSLNGAPAWVDAPVVTPTVAQQAQAAIGAGLAVTSTSTPAINGTYAIADGVAFGRNDIGTEAQFISTFQEFTNGTQTLEWPLIDGKTFVTFPSTATFMAFAKAAAQYYAAVKAVAALGTGTLPSASVTIP